MENDHLEMLEKVRDMCSDVSCCLDCQFQIAFAGNTYCEARVYFLGEVPEWCNDEHLEECAKVGAVPEDLWNILRVQLREVVIKDVRDVLTPESQKEAEKIMERQRFIQRHSIYGLTEVQHDEP